MLYYKDHTELIDCKLCGLPRYFPPKA